MSCVFSLRRIAEGPRHAGEGDAVSFGIACLAKGLSVPFRVSIRGCRCGVCIENLAEGWPVVDIDGMRVYVDPEWIKDLLGALPECYHCAEPATRRSESNTYYCDFHSQTEELPTAPWIRKLAKLLV